MKLTWLPNQNLSIWIESFGRKTKFRIAWGDILCRKWCDLVVVGFRMRVTGLSRKLKEGELNGWIPERNLIWWLHSSDDWTESEMRMSLFCWRVLFGCRRQWPRSYICWHSVVINHWKGIVQCTLSWNNNQRDCDWPNFVSDGIQIGESVGGARGGRMSSIIPD